MTEQTATDLRKAAAILRGDGWTQGDFVDDRDCRCAHGAIIAAVGGDASPLSVPEENRPRLRAAEDAVVRTLGLRVPADIHHWNDDPDRTAQDVIGVLLSTAEMEAAK